MASEVQQAVTQGTGSSKSDTKLLVFLMASAFLAALGQYMMNVALDSVSSYFKVDLATANWMVLGFSIVAGTTIMAAPALLKRFGLTKVTYAGLAATLAGSVLGFFSWDFASMLVARLLQAFTSGIFFPVVSAVIIIVAPEGKKATYIAIDSTIIGVGLAVCPVLSGLLITYFGLKSVFVLPALAALILIILARFCLHDVEKHDKRKVDILSIVLGLVGLFAFMYGLNTITKDVLPAACTLAVGTVVLGLFCFRQTRIEKPLLDLTPVKNLHFSFGEIIIMMCWLSCLFMSLLVPLFLEGTAGLTPFMAGVYMMVPILFYALATYIGGRIEDKHGVHILLPAGVAVILAGLIGMEFASSHISIILLMVFIGVALVGIGLIYAPTKSHDLEAVRESEVSNASSIHSTFAQVVDCIGSALFVGIMSSDVVRLTSEHVSKADAYAAGFSHTLLIDIGIVVVALVLSFAFVIYLKKCGCE